MTGIPKPSSPNSQAKVPRVLLVQARSSPPGVVEKSSSPGGLAVFFPPTLHNPARNSQGGKEIEYSASPVICITYIMIDYD